MNEEDIFLAAQIYPPETGGAATYFSQLADILKGSEKFNPVVVTGYLDNEPLIKNDNGIPVVRICTNNKRIINKYDYPLEFIKDNLNITPDLLHIHPHLNGKEAFFRTDIADDIPVIYDYRGISARINEPVYGNDKYYFSVTEEVDKALLDQYNITQDIIYRAPVTVITENKGEKISNDKKSFRAVFVGSLHKHKGLHIAIEAVKSVSYYIDIEFIIAGDGPEKKIAEEADDEYEFINYLGRVQHSIALAEIEESDVLLVPSKIEGDPRVVLEALSLGTPVIGTDVGTIRERVNNGGIIVKRNITAFTEALLELHKNEDLYKQNVSLSNNYSSKNSMKNTITNAYSEILKS